ncbi:MAG: peptidoglycan endopeptidase [Treponema sp.]|jgi:hypothetical protein|nr:peptidoglycan endopeptidase [Treponema sp.]
MKKPLTAFMIFLFLAQSSATAQSSAAAKPSPADQSSDEAMLAFFSDPSRIWGNGAERYIEEAYRLCFRTRILGGRIMNLRMPFAQNNERDILTNEEWGFLGGGKGNPVFLWEKINEILDSEDFALYNGFFSDGKEKVIIFDLPAQTWTISLDLFDIARMKAGSYRGLPHRPYVLVSGRSLEESDVYNYLYCVGLAGMDCSGFVWHILSYISAKGGTDLGSALSRALGIRSGADASLYAGTAFYNSGSSQILAVNDEIAELKPGDIILFRGAAGGVAHSAVIQSVNFSTGVIRYLQSTDEAPLAERGVHESFIYFDPAKPNTNLKDTSLEWTQKRYPPFPGEKAGPFSDDGNRYRAYPEMGGGRVVRLRAVSAAIERINRSR